MTNPSLFDLNEQFAFYRHYHHRSRVNTAIHFLCVPVIHISALVLLSGLSATANLPLLITVFSVVYCIILDLQVSVLLFPYLATVLIATNYTTTAFASYAAVFKPALAAHLACWTCQIVGHVVFEKNMPALLESFVSAIVVAPLFVVLEMAFLCGFAPGLEARVRTAGFAKPAPVTD
jgi:2-hydroxy fatty acid dioxygenase